MLLHDLIVKVCYKESLFYIIIISIYENLKYIIITENFWTFKLIHYVIGKENTIYIKDLLSS
jgi:hypothetical protein